MPKAKKKAVVAAPAEPPAPPTPPEPPGAPPSPPAKVGARRIVAGESPSKTLLLCAQRKARAIAKKAAAEAHSLVTEYQKKYEVAGRVFETQK